MMPASAKRAPADVTVRADNAGGAGRDCVAIDVQHVGACCRDRRGDLVGNRAGDRGRQDRQQHVAAFDERFEIRLTSSKPALAARLARLHAAAGQAGQHTHAVLMQDGAYAAAHLTRAQDAYCRDGAGRHDRSAYYPAVAVRRR